MKQIKVMWIASDDDDEVVVQNRASKRRRRSDGNRRRSRDQKRILRYVQTTPKECFPVSDSPNSSKSISSTGSFSISTSGNKNEETTENRVIFLPDDKTQPQT